MAYIPAPGICQAELVYVWQGEHCETVLHFEPTASLTPLLMQELGAYLVTWWDNSMQPQMSSTLQLINVKLTDMTTNVAPVINYATGLPLPGTGAATSLPNNVALVVTKRTLLRGRSYRGRIYHPGLTEALVTGNSVDGAFLGTLITVYSMLLNFTTTGTTWDMVVVSRFENNAPRTVADSNQVVSLDSDGIIDSQRRRLPT